MSDYTPDTGRVRHAATEPYGERVTGTEFDRWLEQVRREARAEALEDFASYQREALESFPDIADRVDRDEVQRWTASIEARAAQYREGP